MAACEIPTMNNAATDEGTAVCHVVALPYPGRGHINPMMNLCKLLVVSKCTNDILITFVVTEEWLGFISSEVKPTNIRFATVPNVLPSEQVRAADFPGFIEAVSTKLEAPFEQLLDWLELPVSVIIADTHVLCAVPVGNRRNIPVASLWPMSATMFSIFHHFDLLVQNQHFPVGLQERGDELVDYIPGISSTRLADLPTIFYGTGRQVLDRVLEIVSWASKAQYLLFTSIYEIEPQVIDAIKSKFPLTVYSIGPTIPYFNLENNISSMATNHNGHDYLQWLDSQPKGSVLYVSLGSFLSVSKAQMDEIVAGVNRSGVRYLWVARGETSQFQERCGIKGLVVPWCDQLKVLCHFAIGGFWTHCGWNSTIEAVYAGVPMIAFPIFWDQVPNCKLIVEDWKIGWRVKRDTWSENLVMGDEIAELVQKFMNLESNERKEMARRVKEVQEFCRRATTNNGSSIANLDSFISDISQN